MIAWLGPHWGFIVAAYAATAAVVAGLAAWVGIDHARLTRALAELEARGLRRRSGARR